MGSTRQSIMSVKAAILIAMSLCAANTSAYQPSVDWFKCPPRFPKPMECGHIKVPLDHARPDGDTITLTLTRLRADCMLGESIPDGPSKNPGLYIENGGPGVQNTNSMVSILKEEASSNHTLIKYWEPLRQAYDIIGVDMRGTGLSHPIKCDGASWPKVQWPMIKDKKTYDKVMAANKAWAETCVEKTGPLIHHVSTDQAIHDFEMVRKALSHEKFNYLGFSYGTQLGSEYAAMYPEHVGRMVLDGVVNRHLHYEDRMTTAAPGLDSVFGEFFHWCNTTTACALHGRDAPGIWNSILNTAASGKLRSKGCYQGYCGDGSVVHDWEIILNVEINMHDGPAVFPNKTSNFEFISKQLEYTYAKNSGLAFANTPVKNNDTELFAQWAISCADRDERVLNVADFRNIWTITPLLAPYSRGQGQMAQVMTFCQSWPVKSQNPPRRFKKTVMNKLPPIMFVNAMFDPSTLSPEGLGMRALMPTAFSIYRNGSGHTSFSHQGDTAGAEAAFLVNGVIPRDGTIYQS